MLQVAERLRTYAAHVTGGEFGGAVDSTATVEEMLTYLGRWQDRRSTHTHTSLYEDGELYGTVLDWVNQVGVVTSRMDITADDPAEREALLEGMEAA